MKRECVKKICTETYLLNLVYILFFIPVTHIRKIPLVCSSAVHSAITSFKSGCILSKAYYIIFARLDDE